MPVTVSYPGVYVQEIASGSHAISGVSTSVTAFVGRACLGPVNTPTAVSSFAQFQRMFGGLNRGYPLSYAVHDFFQNGGGEAVVVRLFSPAYSSSYTQADAARDAIAAAQAVTGAATAQAVLGSGGTTLTPALVTTAGEVASAFATASYPAGVGKAGVQASAAAGMASWIAAYPLGTGQTVKNLVDAADGVAAGTQGMVISAAAPVALATVLVQAPPGLAAAWAGVQAVITAAWAEAERPAGTNAATGRSVAQQASAAASGFATGTVSRAAAQTLATALQLYCSSNSGDTPVQVAQQASVSGANGAPGTAAMALNAALNLGPTAQGLLSPGIDAAAAVFAAIARDVGGAATNNLAQIQTDASAAAGNFTSGSAQTAAQAVDNVAAQAAVGTQGSAVMAAAGQAVAPALASLLPSLPLDAASPGDWPNGVLSVSFDQANVPNPSFFNLRVAYAPLVGAPATEQFTGVSLQPGAGVQRLDRVLAAQSNLIRFTAVDYTQPSVALPPLPVSGATGTAGGGLASAPLGLADYLGDAIAKTGLYALDRFDLFNLLVVPPDQWSAWPDPVPQPAWMLEVFQTAAAYCRQRRAFLLVDPPPSWTSEWKQGQASSIQITDLGNYGPEGENAAVYFPNLVEGDPLQNGAAITMAPSGALAGIFARTDAARGVWKAPAGINDGAISGVTGVSLRLTSDENGMLNPQGINCLRSFPVYGSVVWGARTLWGSDARSDDYKFVPVRRLALYVEQSLYAGTQWAVFEPNAEPLWSSLRLAVGSFMNGLFAQGAFAGTSASQAYSVRCDATTTTQTDIDNGVVNVLVGFAPLKPAEFVVLTIQQIAGQIQT